ncbi:MAG: 5-formyltetrahydrofolate cyclo-ligase [Candidatus Handelsmanbacteria bacterium RIFCSPLOWO2_12_FULL_64_10]|uniref:5-formyltetrahydrofolate cyclo-ligase n=1 Tax=Handelsmanbacteria sp. (strain RIFCSPLOWO2_12_FULL_64_10) TaxID=1817868 RepID=A0A1F6D3E9_HANXR|nr:MAG: 5-formyltetrahydrofolate cyclo-ligase [Candidatus Handelsmanbacteria bacterium RIFCSPLOWO2_12_FULL_64_10]
MMDIRAEKARVRQEMIARRRTLSAEEVARKGRSILRHLLALPEYRAACLIHSFVSMPDEVDTRALIEEALASGKRVAVPVVQKGRRDLRHAEIGALGDLRPEGDWGLHQPPPERIRPVSPGEIGLVVVPGLAFDSQGNRVGFGAGYYDRFLKAVAAPKVAVAYAFQVLREVPTTEQDAPVDVIVTEEGAQRCRAEGGRRKAEGRRQESEPGA